MAWWAEQALRVAERTRGRQTVTVLVRLVRTDPKRAEAYLARTLAGPAGDRRLTRGAIQVRRADVAASLDEHARAIALEGPRYRREGPA